MQELIRNKLMKFKNSQKIIFTIFALALALVAFACQDAAPGNSANAPQNAGNAAGNGAVAAVTPAKAPTMTDYPVGNAQSPSEAYRMLFAAVKSQDPAKIKSVLSKGSLALAEMWGGQQKKPVDEVVRNGLHETTLADAMPQMRDERTKGDAAAVEVWNETRKKWDDIPLVKEEGQWKVAFGDQFFGKWESPGKSRSFLEQEAANAKNPQMIPVNPAGANSNVNVINPKQRMEMPPSNPVNQ
jgi:hypothetical protein